MDSEQECFGRYIANLSQCRAKWFKEFTGTDSLIGGLLHYSSLSRPYGPLWSSYVFGYFMAFNGKDVWMMSNGLSNPNHHSGDAHWMQSDGLGCELLVRCNSNQLQIDGMNIAQWMNAPGEQQAPLGWLDAPEMVILDALCGSLVSRFTEFEPVQRLKFDSDSRVKLNYSKYAMLRPMAPDSEFMLTSAAVLFDSPQIELLDGRSVVPLLATPVEILAQITGKSKTSLPFPTPEQAGRLPLSFTYTDPYLSVDLAAQVKAEMAERGAMIDETLTRRFATYTALTLRSGLAVSEDIAEFVTDLDLSSYSTQRQYREAREEKFYAEQAAPQVPLSLFVRSVKALRRKLGLDETGLRERDVDEAANWPEHVSDLSMVGLLVNLNRLDLRGSMVRDLTPLEKLPKLQTLLLADTQVNTLESIRHMSSLKSLQLFEKQIDDLTPLAELSELKTLYLSGTQIRDISPLAGLPELEEIHLSSTLVEDIEPLVSIQTLRSVMLADMSIDDFSPLTRMPNLRELAVSEGTIKHLSELPVLPELEKLYFFDSEISDLSPLIAFSNLQVVVALRTRVTDWSPVDHIKDVRGRPDTWLAS